MVVAQGLRRGKVEAPLKLTTKTLVDFFLDSLRLCHSMPRTVTSGVGVGVGVGVGLMVVKVWGAAVVTVAMLFDGSRSGSFAVTVAVFVIGPASWAGR